MGKNTFGLFFIMAMEKQFLSHVFSYEIESVYKLKH
jgi:hypothetical protein